MDVRNFWEKIDRNGLTKDEIVLVTRYLVDSYGSLGFRFVADKFFKEANIEKVEEHEGSFMEYSELWRKRGCGMDLWLFFCQEKLKPMRHIEDTSETTTDEKASNVDQDNLWTFPSQKSIREMVMMRLKKGTSQTVQKPVRVDLDLGIFSSPEKEALKKLYKYVDDYFVSNLHLADHIVQKKGTDEEPSAGSKKRKRTCEIVTV